MALFVTQDSFPTMLLNIFNSQSSTNYQKFKVLWFFIRFKSDEEILWKPLPTNFLASRFGVWRILRNLLHSSQNHLPFGAASIPTHRKWNHSTLQLSPSQAIISPLKGSLQTQYCEGDDCDWESVKSIFELLSSFSSMSARAGFELLADVAELFMLSTSIFESSSDSLTDSFEFASSFLRSTVFSSDFCCFIAFRCWK